MTNRPKAIVFDLDPVSVHSLREAFPEWELEAIAGATTASLARDWKPGTADLLVVGARDQQVSHTLGLCRALRSQAGRAHVPLVVLVEAAQASLVRAALEAGADSCLVLPVHPADLAGAVSRALAGNQPGQHTLNLDRAQREDPLRDTGGEA